MDYQSDIDAILSHRYDNGADLWATPDKRIGKGSCFSTLGSALMLTELEATDIPVMKETAELILSLWREDGRFQLAPKGAIYPFHTTGAARVLYRMEYAGEHRLLITFEQLLNIQYHDGGWRCNTYKFGRGPKTEYSNPWTTLATLDAFRFPHFLNKEPKLDKAVEFLLDHWVIGKLIGPCLYGMGTLFMKVEFPFFRYNLFYYIYVLSFYDRAKKDNRFLEALTILKSKMVDSKIIVANPNAKLANFSFCKKGEPSDIATERYHEIVNNLR
jgi:hypothetical protein